MFLIGMVAFLAAHLAYIPLFFSTGASLDLVLERWPLIVLLSLYSASLMPVLWPGLGKFRVPVLIYTTIIAAMGIAALGLPANGSTGLILAGAVSFILSDTVLALQRFRISDAVRIRRLTPYIVWFFYWSAQALITYGALNLSS